MGRGDLQINAVKVGAVDKLAVAALGKANAVNRSRRQAVEDQRRDQATEAIKRAGSHKLAVKQTASALQNPERRRAAIIACGDGPHALKPFAVLRTSLAAAAQMCRHRLSALAGQP